MKNGLLSTALLILLAFAGQAQITPTVFPKKFELFENTPTQVFPQPHMSVIQQEDEERDKNGELYRIGVATYVNLTTANSGVWNTQFNGDRVWQLRVKMSGAEALSFLFGEFRLYGDATMDVYSLAGKKLHQTLTSADVMEHFQQNMSLCFGQEMILQLREPAGTQPSSIQIERIMYGYRSTGNPDRAKDFNDSENCEINVNCSPVGDSWQDEKRGVARILVVDGSSQGWCSGTLTNNTSQDCKPLFLTALHCGVTASTADFSDWRFYFRYEAPNCTNPVSEGTLDNNFITGCVKLSSSNDGGGDSGSDFLLVQLGTLANQANTITTLKSANFNAYWNGWDANNTAATGGAGIHHPAGDIKKISTFTGATVSSGYNGNGLQSHWRMTWTANSNGYGVTEGGSSGSPLFNSLGRQIGTLTGGSSYCNAQTSPDYYGKIAYHWTSNGTPANEQLKTHLDPGNTGSLVLNGSANPCSSSPAAPVAAFIATPTTLPIGSSSQFTDQSSNSPTSWAWTIAPAAGWSYTGGTSASTQNPLVTFTTAGTYTVTLVATNAQGSDSEVKTNYITVNPATGPCAATSETCDEFIQNVLLGSINNTTACNNYTSYSASTTLTKGLNYTIIITPQRGTTVGGAYNGDEIAAWIDWNDDNDFTDVGEQVAYTMVNGTFTTSFNFTAPLTAVTGSVAMRVRISYNPDDGAIVPCGTSGFGEVEDYVINIQFVGLTEEDKLAQVQFAPNPTNGAISMDLSSLAGEDLGVTVMDMSGKVVLRAKGQAGSKQELDLSSFEKGVYLVRISNGTASHTERVIKL